MRNLRTAYWVATIIFVLWLIADGLSGIFQIQAGKDSLLQLGYPFYLLTILGSAKLLAAVAILQKRYRLIKEWAFAGYIFICIGAALSWYFVGVTSNMVIALVFLVLSLIPYFLWKKVS